MSKTKKVGNAPIVAKETKQPQIFNNDQFGSVRIIQQEDGEPLFCLKDVCECLDLVNPTAVSKRLESDDLNSIKFVDSLGKPQEMIFVTESGLYDTILGARKNPKTKPFKSWVTKDVLPTIRKTGSYSVSMPALPQTFSEALRMLADKVDENKALTSKLIITEQELKQYQDRFEGVLTRGEWAKKLNEKYGLNISTKRTKYGKRPSITSILADMGITEWIDDKTEVAKQEYVDNGWFINVSKRNQSSGHPHVVTYITSQGQKELATKVKVHMLKAIKKALGI